MIKVDLRSNQKVELEWKLRRCQLDEFTSFRTNLTVLNASRGSILKEILSWKIEVEDFKNEGPIRRQLKMEDPNWEDLKLDGLNCKETLNQGPKRTGLVHGLPGLQFLAVQVAYGCPRCKNHILLSIFCKSNLAPRRLSPAQASPLLFRV